MSRHRFDPVRDLLTLQERMNRLFEDAADRRVQKDDTEAEIESADWIPAADVYEDERAYTLALDLPGIRREGLEVNLDGDRLIIRGERVRDTKAAQAAQAMHMRRSERPFGRFIRSFSLPDAVDRQGITADYKDGVLLLSLPKRTEEPARRVRIDVK